MLQLAEESHKPIIRKFQKTKSVLITYIWGANIADMQLISKFNTGARFYYVLSIFLLCIY